MAANKIPIFFLTPLCRSEGATRKKKKKERDRELVSPANEGEEKKLEALGREETFSRHAPSVHPAVCKELEDNILVVNAMNRQRGSGMILSG